MKRLGLLALFALALAGCGGGGSEQIADVAALETCLQKANLSTDTGEGVDLVAQEASVGAIQVLANGNEIQIAAAESGDEAEGIERSYEFFGGGLVERRGTVVIASTYEPAPDEIDPIRDCLSEQGID